MKKKSSQTAVSNQEPKQDRRWIRKEAMGSKCAEKHSCDRATSNAQWAKSMLRVGFTQIATWQTSNLKKHL